MLVPCSNDALFGPGSMCRPLDFTLYFENSILSITPDVVFLVLAFPRLYYLWHQSSKLKCSFDIVLLAKVLSALVVVFGHAVQLALLARERLARTPAGFAAATIALITTIPLSALILLEHWCTLTPSTLVITFGLVRAVFGSAVLRTFAAIGFIDTARLFFMTNAVCTAAYMLVLLVEMVEKRMLFKPEYGDLPLEASSSVATRSCYFWLFPILWKGRKSTLTFEDLKYIPNKLKAEPAREALEATLRAPNNASRSLVWATIHAFGVTMLAPIVPRILLLLLTFAQPLLVTDMIAFTEDLTVPSSRGWALVGGFACVYGLMVLATALYWEQVFLNIVQYRAALVGCIYLKTLRLASHESSTVGSGAASTYMSVDVERVAKCFEFIHELWAALASILLAVVILYYQASWAAFMPAVVILAVLVSLSYIGKVVGNLQTTWMAATDKRIKLFSSVISQFLPVKWSAYENILGAKIEALRRKETQEATYFYRMATISGTITNNAGIFCTLSVLGTYAGIVARGGGTSPPLDVNRLFTIATIVNLMSAPLSILGQYTPSLFAGYASLKRLQSFFRLQEKAEVTDLNKASESVPEEDILIDLKDASFSWTPDTEPFLHNLTIEIQPGKLHMCIGAIAAGKTMLLKALLGELHLTGGSYEPPPCRLAYTSQDSFIFPGTFRENIIFGCIFDEKRYARTLEACALLPDLKRFPHGDQTRLGHKGASLSGGQRQRLGLARAVYADHPVTLLDDVFSALDAETEEHVFNALFGTQGLLHRRTVILVTHNLHHLPAAGHVLVLDNGIISRQGTLDELRTQGYDLNQARIKNAILSRPPAVSPSDSEPTGTKEGVDAQADQSETLKASGVFTSYKFFLQMNGYHRVIISTLLIFFGFGVARFGAQGYLQVWSESNGKSWGSWLVGYGGLSILNALSSGLAVWYYTSVLTSHCALRAHSAEVNALFATAPSYFMRTSVGRIINRFSQDIFTLDFVIPIALLNGLIQALWLVGTLVLIFIPTPWLALSAPPLGVGYYIFVRFYLGTSNQLQSLEAASKSPLYSMFGTTLSGLETIRAFGSQSLFQDNNDANLNDSQGPFHFRYAGMRFLRTGLALITFFVALGLASLAVALRRTTSSASLGLALSNLTQLTVLLSSFLMRWADIENGTVSLERIHEIVSLLGEDSESQGNSSPTQKSAITKWPTQGSLVFDNVTLRYSEDLPPALSHVYFQVKPGQKVGICGRTGSGKSTIAMSLFRGVNRSLMSGTILVDGVDIQTLPLPMLRQSFSLVSQDPFLWHSSVRENLDPEQLCTDEEIWSALDLVGAKDAVTDLPQKLETVLEDNSSLSRGQKQILCLARVLLRKRQIVILDEASSSMDLETDQKIRHVVREELKYQTVLAIAHRIATIIDFDIILVIEDGAVAEMGSPADLLADQRSRFFNLAATQGLADGATQ